MKEGSRETRSALRCDTQSVRLGSESQQTGTRGTPGAARDSHRAPTPTGPAERLRPVSLILGYSGPQAVTRALPDSRGLALANRKVRD